MQYDDSSLAKNSARFAISSAVPGRPSTVAFFLAVSISLPISPLVTLSSIGVTIAPGEMLLTRMRLALRSTEKQRANERTAALVLQYTLEAGKALVLTKLPINIMDPPSGISGTA